MCIVFLVGAFPLRKKIPTITVGSFLVGAFPLREKCPTIAVSFFSSFQTTILTLIDPLFTILSRAPEAQGKLYSKGSPFHFLLFQGNIQNRTCPKGPPFGFFLALCDFFSEIFLSPKGPPFHFLLF